MWNEILNIIENVAWFCKLISPIMIFSLMYYGISVLKQLCRFVRSMNTEVANVKQSENNNFTVVK